MIALLTCLGLSGVCQPPDAPAGPVEVLRVPSFSEGIVFDAEGWGYISHGQHITRFRCDPKTGKATERGAWAETGGPNGHKILPDGTHLVCDYSRHAVLKLSPDGKVLGIAADSCDGQPLVAPNDLTLDAVNGGFYFTDPAGPVEGNTNGSVYYASASGSVARLATGLAFPNGIVLSGDGKRLYVAETARNRVLVFEVSGPGKVGEARVFADLPEKGPGQSDHYPDGMCLDAEWNLYVAHYGMREVQVLSREGRLIRRYPAGNRSASNVAFGPESGTLFISGSVEGEDSAGAVFRLSLPGVKGLTNHPAGRK